MIVYTTSQPERDTFTTPSTFAPKVDEVVPNSPGIDFWSGRLPGASSLDSQPKTLCPVSTKLREAEAGGEQILEVAFIICAGREGEHAAKCQDVEVGGLEAHQEIVTRSVDFRGREGAEQLVCQRPLDPLCHLSIQCGYKFNWKHRFVVS